MNIYACIFDMKYVYAILLSMELSYRVTYMTTSHFEENIHLYIDERIYCGYKIYKYIDKETHAHTYHGNMHSH